MFTNHPSATIVFTLIIIMISGAVAFLIAHRAQLVESTKDFYGLARFVIFVRRVSGYLHNTAVSLFIPPTDILKTAGTWTDTVGGVADTYMQRRTAADATAILIIPIAPPQNSVAQAGSYLKSIDVWYDVTTAAMDAVTAELIQATLPAQGAAFGAVVKPAFTYDVDHDTAGERLTLDQHKMTITLTTPFWLNDDHQVYLELTIDAAATSVFDIYGARTNFTLRL